MLLPYNFFIMYVSVCITGNVKNKTYDKIKYVKKKVWRDHCFTVAKSRALKKLWRKHVWRNHVWPNHSKSQGSFHILIENFSVLGASSYIKIVLSDNCTEPNLAENQTTCKITLVIN